MFRTWVPVVALLVVAGCQRGREQAAEPPPSGVDVVYAAPEGEVSELVRGELGRARAAGRQLVVYVSAEWCEPCRYFEQAVEEGSLDEQFPTLRLFKFDSDRDDERLTAAGYDSSMIPLFAAPEADGRGGARRFAGAIKGPGAIDVIVPRLRELLAAP